METAVGGGKSVPRYVQIAEEIVQQIRAGILKPGDMVPSESEPRGALRRLGRHHPQGHGGGPRE